MKKFLGVFRYEYKMSIQRVGVWIIVLFFIAFYIGLEIVSNQNMSVGVFQDMDWSERYRRAPLNYAGLISTFLNTFFPIVAGIVAADRAIRDRTLGVRELLRATGLPDPGYILGKYLGVVFSLLTFAFSMTITTGIVFVIYYRLSPSFLLYVLWATLMINGPTLLFITAFSLVCPLFMPTRLYQILFTGYWVWGNYLDPEVMFTVSQTLLNACGRYIRSGFFESDMGSTIVFNTPAAHKALLNIGVLLSCAVLALAGMWLILRASERKGVK